jgi:hypothetical protein
VWWRRYCCEDVGLYSRTRFLCSYDAYRKSLDMTACYVTVLVNLWCYTSLTPLLDDCSEASHHMARGRIASPSSTYRRWLYRTKEGFRVHKALASCERADIGKTSCDLHDQAYLASPFSSICLLVCWFGCDISLPGI